uniref:FERM domain-containing protein n=1 Tax=Steinernema glaseri TaxID=37863 RepID=A0A1I7YK54_9BILA
MSDAKANDYGLFRVEDDPTKCAYLENGKTLEFYLVRNGDTVEYKKKIRPLKVQTLDKSVKTLYVDESKPVGELMTVICSKIGIANHDEYSLVRTKNDVWKSTATLRDDRRAASESRANLNESKIFGTMNRNKEKKMEQLRNKLHTDEELAWLDHAKTLREQNVEEDETLVLRRKFFFSDTNVDSRDPVQLNLLYVQCRDGVLNGLHPVSREKACQLAGYQCLIEYGPFQENRQKSIDFKEVLPKEYLKSKENEKIVMQKYRDVTQSHEQPTNEDPKRSYVKICQELLTYGVTFFLVKEKVPGKNKLIPRLLGVNKECVMRVDAKTKEVLKEWPLEQVRRWAPSNNTFTLDFGDYLDGYYAVKTADGQKIGQLIAGYIDIIIRKKRTRDHLGIEGDEGSTMLEDVVAPAKATLVAHGQITRGYAEDGHVALPGVLRTAGTLGSSSGAQYGAVSGEILQQTVGRGQRARVVESQERAQRALVGTIEASIRSVTEAEEEIVKPPEIKLPDLGDPSHRRWHEERVAVEKEGVEDRIAAMGAATAEVVQLTAVVDEVDHRVGTAIATIGSNLPEMGRGVRELAALMPDRGRAGDLVDAARKLCGAFSDFLNTVNPEHEESRTTVLAAAGRVGDFSQAVISTIEEQTTEEKIFHEDLARKARNVATSTAQLVLRAKTISAECEDQALQDKVIHSATQCAYATSQLVACARVVAPSIETPSCQDQLANAAKQVARAVEELLVDANSATERSRQGVEVGRVQLGDIHEAARQVTSALDGLLDHVKTSPRQVTQTTEEERYEDVLRTSRRLITIQAPDSQDMVRQSENVVRHSRLLVEDLEHEAEMSPEQRDKLLSAARSVAQATSHMIDAAKECQSRPQDMESQMALRSAAEHLVQTTTEATSEQQARRTMELLEQAAKHTAAAATQTIAAASAARPLITSRTVTEQLEVECTETAEYVPRLIASIRESQSSHTSSEKFRAQSRLIKDSTQRANARERQK